MYRYEVKNLNTLKYEIIELPVKLVPSDWYDNYIIVNRLIKEENIVGIGRVKDGIDLDVILRKSHIDYPGVKKAVIDYVSKSNDYKDFLAYFHSYFSEHGLGGDDCWSCVCNYLDIALEFND